MRKSDKWALSLGFLFPVLIISFSFTFLGAGYLLWPFRFFLMVLGGQIQGFGDYVFIGVLIMLNMLLYFLSFRLFNFIYHKISQ